MRYFIRKEHVKRGLVLAACVFLAGMPAATQSTAEQSETITIQTCDGKKQKSFEKGVDGSTIAQVLMDQWKRDHPDRSWVMEEKERHTLKPGANNAAVLFGDQAAGQTYGKYTELDVLTWARETEKFVVEGSRIFHDADLLGSTVGVSCDMCHPHAANTHPETYPKFQVQLGRVALLRDMINWCIEQPLRGQPLGSDDARMRALEAYIIAQRSGVQLKYGKH